jgi:hypothetical protein
MKLFGSHAFVAFSAPLGQGVNLDLVNIDAWDARMSARPNAAF